MRRCSVVAACTAGILTILFAPYTGATPVTTGSEARTFLGGASGKLVYTKLDCNDNSCNKQGRTLWYVDFDDETLVEREIVDYYSEGTEPRNSIISPDGNWVVYNTREWNNPLYACRLQENAPSPSKLADGALPVWWRKPGTDELYVIYVDNDLEDGGWMGGYNGGFPNTQTGATRALQINPTTMAPIGNPQRIMSYQANGGRSVSGAWMFTAGGCPGTFRIEPTGVSNVTIYEEISLSVHEWSDDDTLDGCNPSMSPHGLDSDVRVMYVMRHDDKNHRGYWLCDVRGNNRQGVIWNSGENPYIDEPQWSNHPDYAAAKASERLITAPYDVYICRVWDGSMLKVLEGNYSFPYLWIDPTTIDVKAPKPRAPTTSTWRLALSPTGLRSSGISGVMHLLDSRGRTVVSGVPLSGADTVPLRLAPGVYTVRCRLPDGRRLTRTLIAQGAGQ
ncbi:MAG: hypothetical protein GF331_22775 [Chitinivibrionales bacterium]|nr:hypothetical protein [Chitinivibrionales bacterium]